ncbi:MAG: dolichyl-phosphate beta-glucosyltransferase [Acidobacteriota bacterium]
MTGGESASKSAPRACQLSVIIPAFNEEARLADNLPRIVEYLEQHDERFEILVINDGSYDGTALVGQPWASRGVRTLSLDRNRGKGAAVRHGVLASRGRTILMTDADASTPIDELQRLKPLLDRAALVVASRAVGSSTLERPQPLARRLLGLVFRQVARIAGVVSIRDTQCGFKLMDGETARALFRDMITDGFAFDVELIWLAQQRGVEVREVGVRWVDDPDSSVRPIMDAMLMLQELVRFRLHHAESRPAEKTCTAETST